MHPRTTLFITKSLMESLLPMIVDATYTIIGTQYQQCRWISPNGTESADHMGYISDVFERQLS